MGAKQAKPIFGSSAFSATDTGKDYQFSKPVHRVLQNFLLVWLDANFDESSEDFKKSLQRLRSVVAHITTYKDAKECIDFLGEIKTEKIFMIVSGALGQKIIPEIERLPQLESVYIFCGNKAYHEKWAQEVKKIKGVHTKIEPICEALKVDREKCDREMVAISFDGLDPLFMYTQLLKETLLEIEDDDVKSIKDLVDYCRLQDDILDSEIHKIKHEYRDHSPIWWYTAPYFIYSVLNRGLRIMDTDIILKMGFFIRHLHNDIDKLYREQQQQLGSNKNSPFRVFRGQGLSLEHFEKMKKNNKGGLMSFNNFLSTSLKRDISLGFTRDAVRDNTSDVVGILFVMVIDLCLCEQSSIPYADVKHVGYFKDREAELVFTTHTIFRIDSMKRIPDEHITDRLWEVQLTLVGNENEKMNELTSYVRQEINVGKGWPRLGEIFIRLGEPGKAEHLYQALLEKSTDKIEQSGYYNQLGRIYDRTGDYSKAVEYYQKDLEISKIALPPNHPSLAAICNNIGEVYRHTGEYSKALSSYQQSLEINKVALPPNHPSLAATYNNIGSVYDSMGDHTKGLSSYRQTLEIQKIALPPNHPDLATTYNNIGGVYYNMGEYSKALSSHEKALEIRKIALPPNHPSLAISYGNIGSVYDNMGDYSKALSSYQQSLEIDKIALPPNHPHLATTYNNIGNVYLHTGEYPKALSSYQQSLEIKKIALPPNHPSLATTYNNIGAVYLRTGEYTKALSSYQQSLEIDKIALPPNHPSLATSYNNIGLVYYNMGEYSKALSSYQQSLEIDKIALPPNHPSLAATYNNVGSVYYSMGDYSKALPYFEKALQIWTKSLPPNHPNIATLKNNIEQLKKKM